MKPRLPKDVGVYNVKEISSPDGKTDAIHFSMDDRYFLTGKNDNGYNISVIATKANASALGDGTARSGILLIMTGQQCN